VYDLVGIVFSFFFLEKKQTKFHTAQCFLSWVAHIAASLVAHGPASFMQVTTAPNRFSFLIPINFFGQA
jgi:hypothetical protein